MREEVWISSEIRRELVTLSARLAGRLTLPQLTRWNRDFLPLVSQMRVAAVRERLSICRDPKDDAYLSLAKAVSADFLVTGDRDLLVVSAGQRQAVGMAGVAIVTPREFLRSCE